MRVATLFCLLAAFSGFALAQDTNFSSGPQYLITGNSAMFLRPIATPSLSLSTPPSSLISPTPEPASAEASSPTMQALTPTASPENLSQIYWGSPQTPQPTSEVEISSTEPVNPLPPSFFDTGVTGMTNAETLRERGYGIPLGDVAKYWKSHKRPPRVFTNADVERLRTK